MSREYKPGDVAMVTVQVYETTEAATHLLFRNSRRQWVHPTFGCWDDVYVRKVQPVAVVPFEDREQVERLYCLFLMGHGGTAIRDANDLQAALREFANPTPPKPDEPTGLGAVVVDDNDVTWVLAGRDLPTTSPGTWRAFDGPIVGDWKPWSRIAAVRVLSEGVTS
jgi:hypothetical protein